MKVAVILPAAGLGTRMGKNTAALAGTSRKQFMLLDGSPILIHTVRKFLASDRVGEIVVAVRGEDCEWVSGMIAHEFPSGRVRVVTGSDRNIKVTKPTDMELAHLFLREELAREAR